MAKIILTMTILTIISIPAFSDTYLCIPEAGAGVSNLGNGQFDAEVYDLSRYKLIQTKEENGWVVKLHGGAVLYNHCRSEHYCTLNPDIGPASPLPTSYFTRMSDNTFIAVMYIISPSKNPRNEPKKVETLVSTGKCSKL